MKDDDTKAKKDAVAGESLPLVDPPFAGYQGRVVDESVSDHPIPRRPPEGAPNIILILLDDVGFGQPSPFGGSVSMPNFERLAAAGIKYNRMHTTAMCTPTRAALLTGRNHHSAASGIITDWSTGFPGYHVMWPKSTACVAEILKQHGYSTAALGKWHNAPQWETGPMGPFDRWPTGLGFEYFYGFHGSDTSQWNPALIENTRHVDPPRTPKEGYHLDADLADRAISWLRAQRSGAPDRPFFMYYAPGTAHAPHHAPEEWMSRFKGQFDHGWDVQREITFKRQKELGIIPDDAQLTPRPSEIPAWDSLSDEAKKLGCRLQEAFAATLAHFDHQFGRVLDELEMMGCVDDTMIMFLAGDNGPAGEGTVDGQVIKSASTNGFPEPVKSQLERIDTIGGPLANNNYPAGWAWAGSAPMQWLKQVASHFGGTRNGFVVSWPAQIKDVGTTRSQFHHCIDVVPTILQAAKVPQPTSVNGVPQKPIEGVSMRYSFDDPDITSRRRMQYFELMGHRAIYIDGWVAGVRHRGRLPWQYGYAPRASYDDDPWELYNVDLDFSQARDLAAEEPLRLRHMQEMWWAEAGRHNVLPLDDRLGERMRDSGRPDPLKTGNRFVYYGGVRGIPEGGAPNLKGRSHRITAKAVAEKGTEGVIITQGGRFGGYALFIQEGALHYVQNFVGLERYKVSTGPLDFQGEMEFSVEFVVDEEKAGSGGKATLSVNSRAVAHGLIGRTVPFLYSTSEYMDIGLDGGTPVDDCYVCPFRFTGRLNEVVVEVLSDLSGDAAQQEVAGRLKAELDSE